MIGNLPRGGETRYPSTYVRVPDSAQRWIHGRASGQTGLAPWRYGYPGVHARGHLRLGQGHHLRPSGRQRAQIILANTYHLLARPGPAIVKELGGVHAMMGWKGPILTDSGGYQVFSLAQLRKLNDDGVVFRSHIDGSAIELTPRRAIEVQEALGADIIMQLDECPPHDAPCAAVAKAVERSALWARRCLEAKTRTDQALFAIQQGGVDLELRAKSAAQIVELDLPGYAIGGLSVGEGHEAMVSVLDAADGQFPRSKPRYLMGVGEPRDILAGVARGIDMFDCVLPTRNGRNSFAFTWNGPLRLRNSCHTSDARPLDENCPCLTCRNYSRGTIRHLFMAQEMLGPILLTMHNLTFFAQFMAAIRGAIAAGSFAADSTAWMEKLYPQDLATEFTEAEKEDTERKKRNQKN